MIAGAPGASGSLVILSSSGEMGGKPSLARTATGQKVPAARITDRALHATNTTRRSSMFELPIDGEDQNSPQTFSCGQQYSDRASASIAVFAPKLSGSADRGGPPPRSIGIFGKVELNRTVPHHKRS